jgi:hypothetical protein
MILLDSDVMIDLLRQYPPATRWFDALDDEEELLLPGYVVMELIQGCRNKVEQERLRPAPRWIDFLIRPMGQLHCKRLSVLPLRWIGDCISSLSEPGFGCHLQASKLLTACPET